MMILVDLFSDVGNKNQFTIKYMSWYLNLEFYKLYTIIKYVHSFMTSSSGDQVEDSSDSSAPSSLSKDFLSASER